MAAGATSYSIRDWNDIERSFRVVASTTRPVRGVEWDPQTEKMVEYWEVLEGWSFERYAKNPIILESHDSGCIDAGIGLGSDFKTPDGGLELKVTLAAASAAPRTLELERRIKAGILRGVSVGWDYGDRTDEMRNGRMTRVYRNNVLTEVSLCLIPADMDSLVEEAPSPDDAQRERISNAGRALAQARRTRTDANEDATQLVHRYDFLGTVGKLKRNQVGGIRVPANVTRTGILNYRRPDGTMRRELRLPSEVFNTDSLATLVGAPVTDLAHHRSLINVANWKEAALGHTEDVRKDGNFVGAELVVNDPATIAGVENRELSDISCGYTCKLDHEAGSWNGEPYDAIQRSIRYNHVALLPPGKGRAGSDVALRLDARDADCVEAETDNREEDNMTTRLIRIDGKDLEYGSEQHIGHLETSHRDAITNLEKVRTELQNRFDALEAKFDLAEKARAKAEEDLKEETAGEKGKAKRRAREKLYRKVIRALASDDDADDEDKMDAKFDALDELSDKELRLKVIRMDARFKDDKSLDAKPDAYIEAIFDSVTRSFQRSDGIDSVTDALERVKRTDHGDADPADKARKAADDRMHNAWKGAPAKAG